MGLQITAPRFGEWPGGIALIVEALPDPWDVVAVFRVQAGGVELDVYADEEIEVIHRRRPKPMSGWETYWAARRARELSGDVDKNPALATRGSGHRLRPGEPGGGLVFEVHSGEIPGV